VGHFLGCNRSSLSCCCCCCCGLTCLPSISKGKSGASMTKSKSEEKTSEGNSSSCGERESGRRGAARSSSARMGMRPDGSQATRRRTVRAAFITCRRVFGIAFRTKLGAFILTFCDRLHLINVFSRVDALAETRLLLFLLPSALLFQFHGAPSWRPRWKCRYE
jgi:hypothetical protein